MKTGKPIVVLTGQLLRPLMLGQSAVLHSGGSIQYTLPVTAIRESTATQVCFETEQAVYRLSVRPFPFAVRVNRFPAAQTRCA